MGRKFVHPKQRPDEVFLMNVREHNFQTVLKEWPRARMEHCAYDQDGERIRENGSRWRQWRAVFVPRTDWEERQAA